MRLASQQSIEPAARRDARVRNIDLAKAIDLAVAKLNHGAGKVTVAM